MPAPRTKKRFRSELEVVNWLWGRRPEARIRTSLFKPGFLRGVHHFEYETNEVKGHVMFAEGANAGCLSVGGLDLYMWDGGHPSTAQWEEPKEKEEEEFDIPF